MSCFIPETRRDLRIDISRYIFDNYKSTKISEYVDNMSDCGLITFGSINQPPWIRPEPPYMTTNPLFSRMGNKTTVPNAYYGIGGDILNFRSFLFLIGMKKYASYIGNLTGKKPMMILYDAFLYDLMNTRNDDEYSGKNFPAIFKRLALDATEDFYAGFENGYKRRTFMRKKVFRAMAKVVDLDMDVVSSDELIFSRDYQTLLYEILDRAENDIELWREATPQKFRSKLKSLLYAPMEAAEALTLKRRFGVGLKIGDSGEASFDFLISERDDAFTFAYTLPAVTKSGTSSPYRNRDDITFDMDEKEARNFLSKSPSKVLAQFDMILSELGIKGKNTVERAIDLFSAIKGACL